MPSTKGSGRQAQGWAAYAVVAVATIAARLPFLLHADRFFDADEAVEGLMARHLGDHSLFLWGQRYKGTPEVFLTTGVFSVTGSNVIALKAVTLACFVVFLCANFVLLERVFSRRIAWIATALFVAGPPSLTFWTLSGSAEIVMTLLAGSVLLLAVESGSWIVAAVALGAGLWIQQYILYYVVPIAIVLLARRGPERAVLHSSVRAILWMLGGIAALYVTLGLIAFFTQGIDLAVVGVRITATHPQKMWWIAGAVSAIALGLTAAAMFRTQLLLPAIGFLAGYAPAIIGRIGNHGLGAPISRLDFVGLRAAWPEITGIMAPLLLGFRDPTGSRTTYTPLVLVLVALTVWAYWMTWRPSTTLGDSRATSLRTVFFLLPLVAVAAFLVSGSYIDPQSYRYLMPIYAALPVIYAVGVDAAWKTTRVAGAALLLLVLALFGSQQLAWYQHLQPDLATARTIACLDAKNIHAARAPYWQSYTVTFLTRERIIVSPTDGIDRYEPYSVMTRDAPTVAQICASR